MEYAIRRSDRARRVRVTVDPRGEVTVVLPRRAAERHAAAAVTELAPWIERRRRIFAQAAASVAARGDTVPYLGTDLTLLPEPGRTRVHRSGDTLRVPADPDERRAALERWYRRRAAIEMAPRIDAACAAANLRYARLVIRGQRTRWGSCSATGTLSMNWRLLLAPPEVLDYVIWHEVCHLAHLDHSPRFWALLARHLPGYETPRGWLRAHGATLVL